MGLFAVQMVFAPGPSAANGAVKFMAEELLIQPKAGVSTAEVEDIVRGHSGKIMDEIGPLRVKRIRVPAHALERVKAALEKNPKMEFAEFNYIADSAYIPDDPYYSSQWHLPKISAPEAWDLTGTSTGTTIAVVDSGVDPDHPDLVGKIVPGYNFVVGNDDTHDVLGHGTSVAGTAAAAADNAAGVAGVSWESDIMPLVVLNSEDWATYYDIGRAITYAADHDVRIINVSIGGSSSSLTLQNAADYAWNKNAMVFACAQNYSTETPYYPAACDNVVAVSATTQSDTLASFSNYGDWIDLSAPGYYIYTTKNGGGYGYYNGTSFASPIVAGVAAMILEANPALDNSQVVDILKISGDDLGAQGFDPYFGFGRVNANQAVIAALEYEPVVDATPPEVVLVSPSDWEEVSGTIVVSADATDDVGIQRVVFFLDGAAFQTSFGAPCEFVWNTGILGRRRVLFGRRSLRRGREPESAVRDSHCCEQCGRGRAPGPVCRRHRCSCFVDSGSGRRRCRLQGRQDYGRGVGRCGGGFGGNFYR